MRSMTGYGKAEYSEGGITVTVEIKTVNSRFLDLTPKYPRVFAPLEDVMRKAVQSCVKRGKADLYVNFKDARENVTALEVDYNLANSYYEAYKNLIGKFSALEDDFSITTLMRMPEVIKPSQDGFKAEEFTKIISETVENACKNLNAMRDFEGDKLKQDLLTRVKTCEEIVLEIQKSAPLVAETYRQKLNERISEVLTQTEVDENRLLQEVAIFADKSNIDEELTRLKSHVKQFIKICESEGEVGKKLDFLVQEFNREANTVCSKSNDVSVTDFALKLKCEIEKIREQIQNVE